MHNPALGDADEFLRKHLKLVYFVANKFRMTAAKEELDYDDLCSAGMLGLTKAYRGFRGDNGAKWATFAAQCIRNEILMLLRKTRNKSAPVSLESTVYSGKDGSEIKLSDTLVGGHLDTTSLETQAFLESLSTFEQNLVRMRVAGYTQNEIADHTGLSPSMINRYTRRIADKYTSGEWKKEVRSMAAKPKMTKEEYLRMRQQDMSKASIAAHSGVSITTLYNWLETWGILTAEDERRELTRLESQAGVQKCAPAAPAPAAKKSNMAKLTLDDFSWVRPDFQKPTFRVSKNGVRISGDITRHLDTSRRVELGFAQSGFVAVRNGEHGWKLKTGKRSKSLLISGKRVTQILAQRGYVTGTVLDAEWSPELGVILAHS
ncbi:hypothetical protein GCM10025857_40080 [Alicyclobacillus contaminans]|uniref:sigma-70 family RNA polymerase sigma factor n=1 Tax=Alicyclobacillus contaminans TaxID=392016 RepID=UPI0004203E18|nr:sigma-70 family RNA polymerase sigma factor [Alicyclobacillus contaminans]GMA52592.1 hypothetical protein GCM10025857_39490 [Alicyclobacillus contaminans]GMA52651.1 hypothetical protein GCM10025857_40080 [Alicyclobacillus contaminans]